MRPVSVFLLGLFGSMPASAQSRLPQGTPDSQIVVFVCEHGTVKSVVAMAWFARLAKEHQLPIRAISRGTAPDSGIPRLVREGLKADGFQFPAFSPVPLTAADLASAIAVISFDQPSVTRMVAGRTPTMAWDGLPAVMENYGAARDSIRRRVGSLIDSLSKRP